MISVASRRMSRDGLIHVATRRIVRALEVHHTLSLQVARDRASLSLEIKFPSRSLPSYSATSRARRERRRRMNLSAAACYIISPPRLRARCTGLCIQNPPTHVAARMRSCITAEMNISQRCLPQNYTALKLLERTLFNIMRFYNTPPRVAAAWRCVYACPTSCNRMIDILLDSEVNYLISLA